MRTVSCGLAALGLLLLTSIPTTAQISIFYDGDTADAAPTWTRPAGGPGPGCAPSDVGVDVPYDVQGFLTDAFDVEFGVNPISHSVSAEWDFDGVLLLYEGAFDPADPCANLVTQNEGTGLSADLFAGLYFIVTTGVAPGDAGAFTNTIMTPVSNADLRLDDAPPLSTTELPFRLFDDLWFRPSLSAVPGACEESLEFLPLFALHAFETDTDGLYDFHSEQFEFPFLWDGALVLYEDAFVPLAPCRNLVAANDDYPTGFFWRASFLDDIPLEAGRRYILVTTTFDEERFEGDGFGDYDNTIWGPPEATLTLLDPPVADLTVEIVALPDVIEPGSIAGLDVRVLNQTGAVQDLDVWVELRRYDFDQDRYEVVGMTPPDPVRIPRAFDRIVRYEVGVPGGLAEGEAYVALLKLGTYATDVEAGDLTEFRVTEADAAGGGATWTLRRLSTLEPLAADTEADLDAPDAYPNPFNPATTIRFTLDAESTVSLSVYDVTGREVARLLGDATLEAGSHAARFDASSLASGVYVYRLDTGAAVTTGRLTLLR